MKVLKKFEFVKFGGIRQASRNWDELLDGKVRELPAEECTGKYFLNGVRLHAKKLGKGVNYNWVDKDGNPTPKREEAATLVLQAFELDGEIE